MKPLLPSIASLIALSLASATAAAEEEKGSFWYALDHITHAEPEAEALFWIALPATWHGQEVTITAVDPEPVAILEDAASGNRVIEWVYRPGDGVPPMNRFFHFDFTLVEKPVAFDVDPERVEAYDRTAVEYQRYTRAEPWIQTDAEVASVAREIVGEETNPWRRTTALFEWCVQSLEFVPGGVGELDARSTLLGRRGDCGQYSRLFTAFCRSLGIPARTVSCEWRSGGAHVFAEVLMPGYGWVPADPSLAQTLLPDRGGFTEEEVEPFMKRRGVPLGDPSYLLGHLFRNRVITSVGNEITIDSPTLGNRITFHSLKPGGDDAHPKAYRNRGFNADMVQGGFFLFGEKPRDDERVHQLTHLHLAHKFFDFGLYDVVEDECRQSLDLHADGVQAWINIGKVYLHKGEYHKAEASFKRAMRGLAGQRREKVLAEVWSHIYLGNCYDLLGRREMAIEEYELVVKLGNNYRGAVDYARRFLAEPFTK